MPCRVSIRSTEFGVGGKLGEVVQRRLRVRQRASARRSARRSGDSNRAGAIRRPAGLAVASRAARPSTSTSVITSPSACTRIRSGTGSRRDHRGQRRRDAGARLQQSQTLAGRHEHVRLPREDAQPPDRVPHRGGQQGGAMRGRRPTMTRGRTQPAAPVRAATASAATSGRRSGRSRMTGMRADLGDSAQVGCRRRMRVGDHDERRPRPPRPRARASTHPSSPGTTTIAPFGRSTR